MIKDFYLFVSLLLLKTNLALNNIPFPKINRLIAKVYFYQQNLTPPHPTLSTLLPLMCNVSKSKIDVLF